MRSHEVEPINLENPNANLIKELKGRHLIKEGSPLWWSTDYSPDPREYMSFDEFLRRLVHIGEAQTRNPRGYIRGHEDVKRDVYLYPDPQVPMTVMELYVNGQQLPLLITARPYHKKEINSSPLPFFLYEHPSIDEIPEIVASGGVINLPDHFYPHIRGLFAGKRGNNYFWYHLRISSWWWEFGKDVIKALEEKGLPFIDFYESPMSEDRTYSEVWDELKGKGNLVDQRKPQWIDFPSTEVSVEDFTEDYQKSDLLLFYPLRVDGIENTLPLAISSRSHKESKLRKPIVLGIYAENGLAGRCRRGGVLRIKDRKFAEGISRDISEDFGFPVDTILFTPQKGRPKYERVQSAKAY